MIFDLSELDFADSSLMFDLAILAQRLRTRGRALRLSDPQPQIARLIELIGLNHQPGIRFA